MPDKNALYKVKVNEFEFAFTHEEVHSADLVQSSPVNFNLLKDQRSVNARITEAAIASKKITVEVEGETFHVNIKDQLDQQLEKMGFGSVSGKQIKEIKAPMPGLVLEIAVCCGQEVNEGDKILILEAMKMENSIMINASATIKRIAVVSGQAVEKGQLLVELE